MEKPFDLSEDKLDPPAAGKQTTSSTEAGFVAGIEKPENGLAGLKHWRHDLLAGMVVSLVSVPFSLGIAVASGRRPFAG